MEGAAQFLLPLFLSHQGQQHSVKRECHCERSEAILGFTEDCFVTRAPRADRHFL